MSIRDTLSGRRPMPLQLTKSNRKSSNTGSEELVCSLALAVGGRADAPLVRGAIANWPVTISGISVTNAGSPSLEYCSPESSMDVHDRL